MSGFRPSCPLPLTEYPQVLLAHGGGGTLMRKLIRELIIAGLGDAGGDDSHDSIALDLSSNRIAFTTDSFVVKPLFFPGGDIGSLAVNGTVNDIAMSGARPVWLSLGLVIEEGFPMESLWRVMGSVGEAARFAEIKVVTGDTKVVERGKGDGLFMNTSGIGIIEHNLTIHPKQVRSGDAILLNGDLGRHGMAILAQREGLAVETPIVSDCAPLNSLVQALLQAGVEVHCLRDLTRGGLASALVEIAEAAGVGMEIEESKIPVNEQVQSFCEILGFDPYHVANEGRLAAFVHPDQAQRAWEVMRGHPLGAEASIIGKVTGAPAGLVTVRTPYGSTRILDMLSGEQLPRIC